MPEACDSRVLQIWNPTTTNNKSACLHSFNIFQKTFVQFQMGHLRFGYLINLLYIPTIIFQIINHRLYMWNCEVQYCTVLYCMISPNRFPHKQSADVPAPRWSKIIIKTVFMERQNSHFSPRPGN